MPSDIEVTVSVSSPRRNFDEIETWHWWEVAIEGERLSISSGGHFYRPSTGGDSFTTMTWAAIPEEASELDDYRESLCMVPDVLSFPDGVANIDFAVGGYTVEVTDEDNALLDGDESDAEGELATETDAQPSIELLRTDANDDLPSRVLPAASPGRVCFERIVHGPIFSRKDVMDFAGVPAARLDSWLKKRLIHFRNESQEVLDPRNWNLYEFLQVKILDVLCEDGKVSLESVNNAASLAAEVIVADVLGFGVFVENREATYRPDFGQDRFVISGPYHPLVTPADTTLWDIRRQLVSTTWAALDMNLLARGITVPAIGIFLDRVKTMSDLHCIDPQRFHREMLEGFDTGTYYAFRKLANAVGT